MAVTQERLLLRVKERREKTPRSHYCTEPVVRSTNDFSLVPILKDLRVGPRKRSLVSVQLVCRRGEVGLSKRPTGEDQGTKILGRGAITKGLLIGSGLEREGEV